MEGEREGKKERRGGGGKARGGGREERRKGRRERRQKVKETRISVLDHDTIPLGIRTSVPVLQERMCRERGKESHWCCPGQLERRSGGMSGPDSEWESGTTRPQPCRDTTHMCEQSTAFLAYQPS